MTFYYRELSAQLRLRQVPETQVVDVLDDVRNLCQETGQPPEQQFGPAADYARTFSKGQGRSPLVRSFMVFVGVCLLAEFFFLMRWEVQDQRPPQLGGVPVLGLLLAAQLVALFVTFGAHYRLPKGFGVDAETRS